MSDPLDLPRIARAFDRAASTYDAAAYLQAIVREELLGRLEHFALAPRIVLDVGCGTGAATVALAQRYGAALTLGIDVSPAMLAQAGARGATATTVRANANAFERICADAHRLPLADGTAQLVFSSLMLQWSPDPDACLRELRRVMAPGALLCLASFGPSTLRELRAAWRAADEASPAAASHEHVSAFIDLHDLGGALVRAGFSEPVLDVDTHLTTYATPRELMRELQAIGARNATAQRPRALTGRARLARLEAAYERFRLPDGALPASWEVVYVAAFATESPGSRRAFDVVQRGGQSEVPIPADRITRRRGPSGP